MSDKVQGLDPKSYIQGLQALTLESEAIDQISKGDKALASNILEAALKHYFHALSFYTSKHSTKFPYWIDSKSIKDNCAKTYSRIATVFYKLAQKAKKSEEKKAFLYKALKAANESIKISQEKGILYNLGNIYFQLGELHSDQINWLAGKYYLERAKELYISVLKRDPYHQASKWNLELCFKNIKGLEEKYANGFKTQVGKKVLAKKEGEVTHFNLALYSTTKRKLKETLRRGRSLAVGSRKRPEIKAANELKFISKKEILKAPNYKEIVRATLKALKSHNESLNYEDALFILEQVILPKYRENMRDSEIVDNVGEIVSLLGIDPHKADALANGEIKSLNEKKPQKRNDIGVIRSNGISGGVSPKKLGEGRGIIGKIEPQKASVLLRNVAPYGLIAYSGFARGKNLPGEAHGNPNPIPAFTIKQNIVAVKDTSLFTVVNHAIDTGNIKFYDKKGKETKLNFSIETDDFGQVILHIKDRFDGVVAYKLCPVTPNKPAAVDYYRKAAMFSINYPQKLAKKLDELDKLPIKDRVWKLRDWLRLNIEYDTSFGTAKAYADYHKNPSEPFVNFLLKLRKGDCECGNIVFATILRTRYGIPARLAGGYIGAGGLIRNSGHAWTEVFYDDKWHNVDATPSPRAQSSGNFVPGFFGFGQYLSFSFYINLYKQKPSDFLDYYYSMSMAVRTPQQLRTYFRVLERHLDRNNRSGMTHVEAQIGLGVFLDILTGKSLRQIDPKYINSLALKYASEVLNETSIGAGDIKTILLTEDRNIIRQFYKKLGTEQSYTQLALLAELKPEIAPEIFKLFRKEMTPQNYYFRLSGFTRAACGIAAETSAYDQLIQRYSVLFLQKSLQFYKTAPNSWLKRNKQFLLCILAFTPKSFQKTHIDFITQNFYQGIPRMWQLHASHAARSLALLARNNEISDKVLKFIAKIFDLQPNNSTMGDILELIKKDLQAGIEGLHIWDIAMLKRLAQYSPYVVEKILEGRLERILQNRLPRQEFEPHLLLLQEVSRKSRSLARQGAYESMKIMQGALYLDWRVESKHIKQICKNLVKLIKRAKFKPEEVMAFINHAGERFIQKKLNRPQVVFWGTLIAELLKSFPWDKQYLPVKKIWAYLKRFPKRLRFLLPAISGLNYSFWIKAANGGPEQRFYDETLEYEVVKACQDNFGKLKSNDRMIIASRFLSKVRWRYLPGLRPKYNYDGKKFFLNQVQYGKWERVKLNKEMIDNLSGFALNGSQSNAQKRNFIITVESKFKVKLAISAEEREVIMHPRDGISFSPMQMGPMEK